MGIFVKGKRQDNERLTRPKNCGRDAAGQTGAVHQDRPDGEERTGRDRAKLKRVHDSISSNATLIVIILSPLVEFNEPPKAYRQKTN